MMYVGANRVHLDETESTNKEVKELFLAGDLASGTLLTTSFQTDGKGQMGAVWESYPGLNFLGTYFLQPVMGLNEVFALNMISSLAVKETISDFVNRNVEIKWPNDILLEGRKISGILIETKIQEGKIKGAFIGIGININQLTFSKFGREATSLKKEKGIDCKIESVIQRLNRHVQQFYTLYKLKGYDSLNYLYHQELYLKGEECIYYVGKDTRYLTFQSVNKRGDAQFFNQNGKIEEFGFKQIRFSK